MYGHFFRQATHASALHARTTTATARLRCRHNTCRMVVRCISASRTRADDTTVSPECTGTTPRSDMDRVDASGCAKLSVDGLRPPLPPPASALRLEDGSCGVSSGDGVGVKSVIWREDWDTPSLSHTMSCCSIRMSRLERNSHTNGHAHTGVVYHSTLPIQT